MSKIVITKLHDKIVSSVFNDTELVSVNFSQDMESSFLNNIYVGRVENIVKNINAAFIAIGPDTKCYFSLDENPKPYFINNKNSDKLNVGDLILVQVTKDAIKTKMAVASSNLSLQGKYVVLNHGNPKLGISNKIGDVKFKNAITEAFLPLKNDAYGFVIRTNAYETTMENILNEANMLIDIYNDIISIAKHRPAYTKLYSAPQNFVNIIRNANAKELSEIVVEDIDIYEYVKEYLWQNYPEDSQKLRLYKDDLLSLNKLYNIENRLNDALKERVWLKSGGYLIIQPTEALVVIDVNTGKFDGKNKDREATFLKINKEAANEIAKQLILRNLSGIIIIDFIDMIADEMKEELLEYFARLLKRDPVKTTLMGMTKLGLVEITRKKVLKPLYEEWKSTKN
ncbi:MAG: ribonuclease E/G [Lachnospira sp.]|nr:ribonuclease E/G [Lachnospira sp.]